MSTTNKAELHIVQYSPKIAATDLLIEQVLAKTK
jgi:hypothetical protein